MERRNTDLIILSADETDSVPGDDSLSERSRTFLTKADAKDFARLVETTSTAANTSTRPREKGFHGPSAALFPPAACEQPGVERL